MAAFHPQFLAIVRHQIDHQQPATGPQHTRGLRNGGGGIVGEMQHLVQHQRIGARGAERHFIHVAGLHAGAGQAHRFQPIARDAQHFRVAIQPQRAAGARAQQFHHAPRAGANIDQIAQITGQRGHDGLFHAGLAGVQAAFLFPFAGVGGKPAVHRCGAIGTHLAQPCTIAGAQIGSARHHGRQRLDRAQCRTADRRRAQPHEHPGAFAYPLHQA